MKTPLHDSRLKRAGDDRVGHSHFGATDAELGGAEVNLLGKAKFRTLVYGLIVQSGSDGMTNAEIQAATNATPNTVSGRLNELETKDELIFRTGERRKTASASVAQNIYRAVPPETTLLPADWGEGH